MTYSEQFDSIKSMKPDKKICLYCGKQIEGRKMYCDDAHRMAYRRNPNKPTPEVEHLPEQSEPEHEQTAESEQPEQLRDLLSKTDKTFYDRAVADFKKPDGSPDPYYKFGHETHDEQCLQCGAKFKTSLKMLRFCSYTHYNEALRGKK